MTVNAFDADRGPELPRRRRRMVARVAVAIPM